MHLGPHDLIVSTTGNDDWSGRLAEPVLGDGPLRSVTQALWLVRAQRDHGLALGAVTIWVRGGRHELAVPIEFLARDHGITVAAWPGEQPVLSGGTRITGWTVGSRAGRTCWSMPVAMLLDRHGPWRSLYVNGSRRARSRFPKHGWLWMEHVPGLDFAAWLFEGNDRFVAKPGDIPSDDLTGVEAVVAHYWVEERMPVRSWDQASGLLVSSHRSCMALKDSFNPKYAKYCLDNAGFALSEPGEWWLDQAAGMLHYLPLDGEDPATVEVVVPILPQLVRLVGNVEMPVRDVTLRGLSFAHTDWHLPRGFGVWYDPYTPAHTWGMRDSFDHLRACLKIVDPFARDYATTPQAALHVPGALHAAHAHGCVIERCTIQAIGWYGVSFYEGCQGNTIEHCTITDLGAGGIIADGGDERAPAARRTGNNRFLANRISSTGHVWSSACGIVTAHSAGNLIRGNHLEDLTYTGISCGWEWGYAANPSRDNRIEANRINRLAERGGMADLGGIYLLGAQPGTVVCGNVISGVANSAYGGWGIYLDEGTGAVLIEDNLVYDVSSHGLHEHWGRNNTIRNNAFIVDRRPPATGDTHGCGMGMTLARDARPRWAWVQWPPAVTTLEGNLFVLRGGAAWEETEDWLSGPARLVCDRNLYWDADGTAPVIVRRRLLKPLREQTGRPADGDLDLSAWQALGHDRGGIVADPGFVDLAKRDFRFRPEAQAVRHGFRISDWAGVGAGAGALPLP